MDQPDIALAIDLGASGGRVIAAELRGDMIQLKDVHRFENAPLPVGNRLLWNLLSLWKEVEIGIGKAVEEHRDRIVSLGVDTWGVDYVLLDRNDDLVGPAFCYRDPRTRGMMDHAFKKISRDEIFQETGIQFMEINSLYQLYSMRVENSPILDIADRFLMIPDFFHWMLTGEKVNEFTNASTTQMMQPGGLGWSSKILDKLGIPEKLFRTPVQPGCSLGSVRSQLRNLTGLSQRAKTIVPATHDTGAAVLAVPAKGFSESQPNWCYISSGTWSLMGVELSQPRLNAKCSQLNFTNEGGTNGTVRLLKNIAGLWPLQQCRASWQRRGKPYDWTTLATLAREAKPLAHWIDVQNPAFIAPEDMLDAVVGYFRLSGQTTPNTDGAIVRSILESLAMRYRICLGMLEDLLGYSIETIHIVGGGVRNQLLCQMTADACNRTVVAGPVEATALGNVISQMLALGRFKNVGEARAWMLQTSSIDVYEPKSPEAWDESFNKIASHLS